MEYRAANKDDLQAFLENRMEFVTSIRHIADKEAFQNSTKAYLEEHLGKDDFLVYLAVEQGEIIASCMACVFTSAPLPSCLSGKSAELLNVYTKSQYRGQGHAKKLITLLLADAKNRGVGKVWLSYTKDGLPLYQKLGFTVIDNYMELRI